MFLGSIASNCVEPKCLELEGTVSVSLIYSVHMIDEEIVAQGISPTVSIPGLLPTSRPSAHIHPPLLSPTPLPHTFVEHNVFVTHWFLL